MNNLTFIMQLKNDTAANLASQNPILAKAEMALESDTNKFKFGDGETHWNDLPYAGGGAGSFQYGEYALSADQTTNLGQNQNIAFDTRVNGSLPLPSNGVITLPAGKTYKISFTYMTSYSNSNGFSGIQMYNITASQFFGTETNALPVAALLNYSAQPSLIAFITTTQQTDIAVRIVECRDVSAVYAGQTRLIIEEYGGY